MNRYDVLVKLLLIGDSGCGKTCCLVRYTNDEFSDSFGSTIGVDFKIKTIMLGSICAKLQIWDTAGQERFRTITQSYFRGAHGIVLMFDLTDKSTFDSLNDWFIQILTYADQDVNVLLVGNKCDAEDRVVVDQQQIDAFAAQYGIQYFDASAKMGINIETAFVSLAAMTYSSRTYEAREESCKRLIVRLLRDPITNKANIAAASKLLKISAPKAVRVDETCAVVSWRGDNFDSTELCCLFEIKKRYRSDEEVMRCTRKCFAFHLNKWNTYFLSVRAAIRDPKNMSAYPTVWGEWSDEVYLDTVVGSSVAVAEPRLRQPQQQQGYFWNYFMPQWRDHWMFSSTCARCRIPFTWRVWRHHCRQCGQSLCDKCCPSNSMQFVEVYGMDVKVCLACVRARKLNDIIKTARNIAHEPEYAGAGLQYIRAIKGLAVESSDENLFYAEGATSIVFRGTYNDVPVAIKLYKHSFVDVKDRIVDERKVFSMSHLMLEHHVYQATGSCPHAVKMLMSRVSSGVPYPFIVLELYDKHGTLDDVLKNKHLILPWMWRLKALLQIASFLVYMHGLEYVHGDVKAANCIVHNLDSVSDDLVRVFDFNSSDRFGLKTYDEIDILHRTVTHTPPEVLRILLKGKDESIDSLSVTGSYDIYSFGILMCEVALRELCYMDEMAVSQIRGLEAAMVRGERPLIQGDDIPDGYTALCVSCWHDDPTQRPSAEALVLELQSVIANAQIKLHREKEEKDCITDVIILDLAGEDVTTSDVCPDMESASDDNYCMVETLHNASCGVSKNVTIPPYIVILKSSDFIWGVFKKYNVHNYMKIIPGLKAFPIGDPALENFVFKGLAGQYEIRTVYKHHPGSHARYIPLHEFAEDMMKVKEEEFFSVMRGLGAKSILVKNNEQRSEALEASVGIYGAQLGAVGASAQKLHADGRVHDRYDEYENPYGSTPSFDTNRKYLFYNDEPEWVGIKDARLSPQPILSTNVTLKVTVDDFNLGSIMAKVNSIGGLTAGASKSKQNEFSKTYAIEFFSLDEYTEHNRSIMNNWGTLRVLQFLDKIQMQELKAMLVEHSIKGCDLLSADFDSIFQTIGLTSVQVLKLKRSVDEHLGKSKK